MKLNTLKNVTSFFNVKKILETCDLIYGMFQFDHKIECFSCKQIILGIVIQSNVNFCVECMKKFILNSDFLKSLELNYFLSSDSKRIINYISKTFNKVEEVERWKIKF